MRIARMETILIFFVGVCLLMAVLFWIYFRCCKNKWSTPTPANRTDNTRSSVPRSSHSSPPLTAGYPPNPPPVGLGFDHEPPARVLRRDPPYPITSTCFPLPRTTPYPTTDMMPQPETSSPEPGVNFLMSFPTRMPYAPTTPSSEPPPSYDEAVGATR